MVNASQRITLQGVYTEYFADLSGEVYIERMLDLAKNYNYHCPLNSFTWGTCSNLNNEEAFSPELQDAINGYNALLNKNSLHATGYFAFMYTSKWVAFYTPDDDGSVVIDITENEAGLLAKQFYENGFIELNKYL